MSPQTKDESIDELILDAENTIHKGLERLGQWGHQARELVEKRPELVSGLAGLSGFVLGTLVRQSLSKRKPGIDPLWLAGSGLVAGVLLGPGLLRMALTQLDKLGEPEHRHDFETIPLHGTGTMNERPFERT